MVLPEVLPSQVLPRPSVRSANAHPEKPRELRKF